MKRAIGICMVLVMVFAVVGPALSDTYTNRQHTTINIGSSKFDVYNSFVRPSSGVPYLQSVITENGGNSKEIRGFKDSKGNICLQYIDWVSGGKIRAKQCVPMGVVYIVGFAVTLVLIKEKVALIIANYFMNNVWRLAA